jgi:hypothetical protein
MHGHLDTRLYLAGDTNERGRRAWTDNFTRIEPRDQIANDGYYVSPPCQRQCVSKALSR